MSESLTKEELEFHNSVVKGINDAQAVMTGWSRHLSEKYKLGVGDKIEKDGTIIRGKKNVKKDTASNPVN